MVEHCVGTAEQGGSAMMQKLVAAAQLRRWAASYLGRDGTAILFV